MTQHTDTNKNVRYNKRKTKNKKEHLAMKIKNYCIECLKKNNETHYIKPIKILRTKRQCNDCGKTNYLIKAKQQKTTETGIDAI